MDHSQDQATDSQGKKIPEVLIFPDGRQVVVQDVGTASTRPAKKKKFWQQRSFLWAIGLFFVTCLSTWYVGENRYNNGFGYMFPVMLILLAHEMGHYITSLIYRVPVSPPYFLPMPFTPLGTFGAVIVRQGGREERKVLFDIAIAGPLAGLVVAIPVCIYGAMTAVEVPHHLVPVHEYEFMAPPFVGWIVKMVRGSWPPGVSMESAVLDAGWVGIFITALNLIPIGQLDGGHILYTLIGKKAHRVATGLIVGTFVYMILSGNPTFMLMLFLIVMMGPYHPPTANDNAPLGKFRIILGWVTLAFILVGFSPTPIVVR